MITTMYEKADAIRENIYASRSGDHGMRNLMEELVDVVCEVAEELDRKHREAEEAIEQRKEIAFADEIARDMFDLDMGTTPSASQRDEARRVIKKVKAHD